MGFIVTPSAARYIAQFLAKAGLPLIARATLEDVAGCGDKNLSVAPADGPVDGDTMVIAENGLRVLVHLGKHPTLRGATLDLDVTGLNRRLVLRSETIRSCGCGMSYSTKE